jgi:ubiquinone/menaquinone biosynthesis C-methylase UbiE
MPTRLLLSTSCSPIEINHYIYNGRRDMANKPFRMLVAGGGTGDATLTAAMGFAALGNKQAIIYHLDMSAESIEVARKRLTGLADTMIQKQFPVDISSRVRFVQGSLLDLPTMAKEGTDN